MSYNNSGFSFTISDHSELDHREPVDVSAAKLARPSMISVDFDRDFCLNLSTDTARKLRDELDNVLEG